MIHYCGLTRFVWCILCVAGLNYHALYAQEIIRPNVTNSAFLKENGAALLDISSLNRANAFAIAKEKGWKTFGESSDGNIFRLQRTDDRGLPVYYITTNNVIAAGTTRTTKLYTGGGLGLSLNGSSISAGKVAIWDSEGVLASHVEFAGGRIEVRDKTTTTAVHSTHVAGTMIAAGVNAIARGMAFGLPKLYVFNFDNDTPEMSANAATLLISNHSYGTAAGWSQNTSVTPERWEFLGAPGENEDYKFGYYDTECSEWDKICYNAPYYLPVKSAGNSRTVNGPAIGENYYRYNASRVMSNAGPRPEGISSNDSYDNISTYGTAKNILTVGAINPLANGPYTAANIRLTTFSSWGPTDDGRIKPDLVADGVRVTSTSNAGNNSYTILSGTSMSTPNVSGSLILLQELYSQKNGNNFMRSATLKALAIGTATDAGTAEGPDYSYGWGLLNMEAAAQAILDNGTRAKIAENILSQGDQQFLEVTATGTSPIKATICWTDPEAVAISSLNGLNNRTPRLINDLDLRAVHGSESYNPWVLDPANPAAAAIRGDNTRDNVEQVLISNPLAGAVYRFKVSHKGQLKRGPQAYSILITGINGDSNFSTTGISNNELNMVIYPVPAKNEINVSANIPENTSVQVKLINISGQVLYQDDRSAFTGIYQHQINTSSYVAGIYFIVLKVGNKSYTKKFICTK
ncbi:S8 family serine peptidase [Pedobacter sp. MC2016-15]|uniref:S8 family serine peptidase n=1 Tax=Pedobacter sp. MC2016-15 TaxID=2994473 RepID=UPI002245DF74|nr:S8 family serine peptidase [Pedobacter sp. MC2016-15]MCX2481282.1 S8 family serine peptidase [Pedobacter sp. MC2016-15]